MPDDFDDPETDQPDDTDEPRDNHDIRQLREKAKRADELESRLAAVEREAAFAKALGDRLTDPKMAYFQKAYDGDLTVEAIREAAKRDGFWAEPTGAGGNDRADLDAAGRMAAASTGAGEPLPPDLHEAVLKAQSADEVLDILEAAGVPTTRTMQ
jgi:hypothetical protein